MRICTGGFDDLFLVEGLLYIIEGSHMVNMERLLKKLCPGDMVKYWTEKFSLLRSRRLVMKKLV